MSLKRLIIILAVLTATAMIIFTSATVFHEWRSKRVAYLALKAIQKDDSSSALQYFYFNEASKRANDFSSIFKKISKRLNSEQWSIRAVVREGNVAWVIIYFTAEPGEDEGVIEYIRLVDFGYLGLGEGWKIKPDGLFREIKWVND